MSAAAFEISTGTKSAEEDMTILEMLQLLVDQVIR